MCAGFPARTVRAFLIYGPFWPHDPFTNSEWWGKNVKGNRAGLSALKFPSFAWWDWRKSWDLLQGRWNASRNSSKAPQEYINSCYDLSRLARWRLCWIGKVQGRYFIWQIPSLLSRPVADTSICHHSSSSRFSLVQCSWYNLIQQSVGLPDCVGGTDGSEHRGIRITEWETPWCGDLQKDHQLIPWSLILHVTVRNNNNNNNNNNTKYCATKILHTETDSKCRLCQQHDDTIDHIISACPILAKEEYVKRHDKVSAQIRFHICKETGVQLDKKHWYEHVPNSVVTNQRGKVTILWN